MTPHVARAVVRAAYLAVAPPLPVGFMPLWAFGLAWDVPCLANQFMSPEQHVFSIDYHGDGRRVLVAHGARWAANGATNLAAVYDPHQRDKATP